ncbi:MAG: metallophosphoesterase [Planctomycetota bacterium]|jgi:predicted MPP superfamily phosphohydrolase
MKARRHARQLLVMLLLALPLALGGWAFVVEPASLGVHEEALALPTWPATHAPLRIALLADLHTGSPFHGLDTLAEIVDETNATQPDLVLLAGDYVIHGVKGGEFVPPEDIAAALGRLSAPLGVYAVLGNHDHWLGAPRVRGALFEAGIEVLEDDARRIERPGGDFWVVGLSDFWEGACDVEDALAQVTDDAPALAFMHNPDLFPRLPGRFALVMAGHTHGGQVHLPLLGRPIVPSRYGERYAAGLVVEEGRHLFVSTGLGTSILPVRFRVPPEIVLLTVGSATR